MGQAGSGVSAACGAAAASLYTCLLWKRKRRTATKGAVFGRSCRLSGAADCEDSCWTVSTQQIGIAAAKADTA